MTPQHAILRLREAAPAAYYSVNTMLGYDPNTKTTQSHAHVIVTFPNQHQISETAQELDDALDATLSRLEQHRLSAEAAIIDTGAAQQREAHAKQ